jgi:hypothetical protein
MPKISRPMIPAMIPITARTSAPTDDVDIFDGSL